MIAVYGFGIDGEHVCTGDLVLTYGVVRDERRVEFYITDCFELGAWVGEWAVLRGCELLWWQPETSYVVVNNGDTVASTMRID